MDINKDQPVFRSEIPQDKDILKTVVNWAAGMEKDNFFDFIELLRTKAYSLTQEIIRARRTQNLKVLSGKLPDRERQKLLDEQRELDIIYQELEKKISASGTKKAV